MLVFIVLPLAGTFYSAYHNGHTKLLLVALAIGLLVAAGLALAEARIQAKNRRPEDGSGERSDT